VSVLDDLKTRIERGLDELDNEKERVVAEFDRERAKLTNALKELGGKARGRGGRPKGSGNKGTGNKPGPKPGRRKRQGKGGGPTRHEQILEHLRLHPGDRTKDIATHLGISSNQVSSLVSKSREEGTVKTEGTRHSLTGAAAPASAAPASTTPAASSKPGTSKSDRKKRGRRKAKKASAKKAGTKAATKAAAKATSSGS